MNRKKLSIMLTGAMIASCAYAIPANANSMPKNEVSITANKEIDTINPTYNSNVIKQINSIATSKNKIGPNVAGAFVKQHWYVYMGNMTFKAPNKTVADAFNGATVSITEAGNSFGGGTLVLDNKNTLVANDITPGQLTTLGKHPMTITISKNGEILYTTTTSIDCAPLTYFIESFPASNLKAGESYPYYSNGVKLGEVVVQNEKFKNESTGKMETGNYVTVATNDSATIIINGSTPGENTVIASPSLSTATNVHHVLSTTPSSQNGWGEYTGLPWSCNAKTKNINIANNKIIKKTFVGPGMPGTLTGEKIKNPTGYSPDYTTVDGVPSVNGVSISKFPVKNEVVDVYLLQGSKPTTTIKVEVKGPNGIINKDTEVDSGIVGTNTDLKNPNIPKGYEVSSITKNNGTTKVVDGKIPNGTIPKTFGKKDETIIYNIKKIPTNTVTTEVVDKETGKVISNTTETYTGLDGSKIIVKTPNMPKGYHLVKAPTNIPSVMPNKNETIKWVAAKDETTVNVKAVCDGKEVLGVTFNITDNGTVSSVLTGKSKAFDNFGVSGGNNSCQIYKQTYTSVVIYTGISSSNQKDDLKNQIKFLRQFTNSSGIIIDEVIEDYGSGLNYNRKKWNKLIDECMLNEIDTIYITHKDRFIRFGYSWFERSLAKFNVKIIVVKNESLWNEKV